ncbi:MAG: hypothetical protein U1E36_03675 [Rickettsiales bacterium]
MKSVPSPETTLSVTARALSHRRKLALSLKGNDYGSTISTSDTIFLPNTNVIDTANDAMRYRGELDLAAFGKRYHNHMEHLHRRPATDKEARVFDRLEVARLEILASKSGMKGLAHNLAARTDRQLEQDGISGQSETPWGEVLAGVLREVASGQPVPKSLDRHTARVRLQIEKHAYAFLEKLAHAVTSQKEFASLSRELITALGGMETGVSNSSAQFLPQETEENSDQTVDSTSTSEQTDDVSTERGEQRTTQQESGEGATSMSEEKGDDAFTLRDPDGDIPNPPSSQFALPSSSYRVFRREFDEIIFAHELVPADELVRLRAQLDEKLTQVRGTFSKLSAALQRLLLARKQRAWEFDLEDGMIHSARLARLVASPVHNQIFKREKDTDFKDTVVTLLLDNSGSMRGRPITIAALSADILAKTLERAGVKVEILGFTTKDWKGGQSYKEWVKENRPSQPGRLNDLRHIIYKPADLPFVRARRNLGLMLKDGLLKENIDGEALLWAYERLRKRPEERKILMVISDGAPVDDATLSANSAGYLDKHLREAIAFLENKPEIELLAIGIGHDVTRYYKHSVTLNDVSRLGETMTQELVKLFEK